MYSIRLAVAAFFLFSFAHANKFASFNGSSDKIKALSSSDGELIFAHIIYRHGDRNIGRLYPNDPWRDEIYWPEGYGELNTKGMKEQYKLGQYFRRRYGQLLGDKYSPKNIYIRSSDMDRCIMSALVNMAAIFPLSRSEAWNDNILWAPIPIHSVPVELDHIIENGRHCPKYDFLFEKNVNESTEIQRIFTEYAEYFSNWTRNCGANITSFDDVKGLYKTLLMETAHNRKLQPWAKKAIEPNSVMQYISEYSMKLATDTPQLARLSTGFLLKDIFKRISHKINGTLQPDRSVYMYSAHDKTVANVLNSLGLFQHPHIPPFAASILIELYKKEDGDHYIQIFYRKSGEENPLPLNIPNCGHKCTLERLHEIYSDIIAEEYETECSLAETKKTNQV